MSSPATFAEILEAVDCLSPDEQQDLVEVVRRRLASKGRERIASDVRDGRREFADGNAKPQSVDEILRDVER